eukprot:7486853-Pyramimonas_sp.AAC.1
MEITQKLSFSETITRTARWCTRKQALEVYSDSELDEMVANDKIEVPMGVARAKGTRPSIGWM